MKEEIDRTVEAFNDGGVVVYPTETIWGLGCLATNEESVKRLFDIKERHPDKSPLILVDDFPMLERYATVPEVAWDLLNATEDAITVVYPESKNLPVQVCGSDGTVAIRVTRSDFCKRVIQKLRQPIVSTSANLAGDPSPLSFGDINPTLLERVDYVINLPDLKMTGKASSIIKLGVDGEVKILRT